MRRQLVISVLTFFFLFTGQSSGQRTGDSFPFFFVQVTDPQFGFFDGPENFTKETSLYSKAVGEINRIKPDFVVITGDLVNDKTNHSQWDELSRITSMIRKDVPVYFIPGNHDIGNLPADTTIGNYTLLFGYDRFSFIYKKCLFIGLNSPIIKAGTSDLEQKQFEWLKGELKKAEEVKHVIIFSHHPFFIKDPDEPETYSNIAPQVRSEYLDLFGEYDVDLILSGHYHNNGYGVYNDIEMITTSSVGRPLGDAPSGMRIIEIYTKDIISTYYGLHDIPDTIKMTRHKTKR